MFPRTALIIVALLVGALVAFFIRGAFVAQQAKCTAGCVRNIAEPYKMLVSRMRQLAEAGHTDELRKLIVQVDEHSADVSNVCGGSQKDSYAMEVYEWTR